MGASPPPLVCDLRIHCFLLDPVVEVVVEVVDVVVVDVVEGVIVPDVSVTIVAVVSVAVVLVAVMPVSVTAVSVFAFSSFLQPKASIATTATPMTHIARDFFIPGVFSNLVIYDGAGLCKRRALPARRYSL